MSAGAIRRRRTLPVLAALLAVAAALKLATGIGAAIAQNAQTAPDAPAPARSALVAPPAAAPPDPGAGHLPELVLDLRRREADLAARLASLAEREAALAEAEARIRAQIEALQQAERGLAATMAMADQAAEADLQRLTAVFEAMRPEQAAQVVAEMAPDFAAGLIGRLRPETAAAVLAGIEPRLAYGLSAILAGRNAEVPRR